MGWSKQQMHSDSAVGTATKVLTGQRMLNLHRCRDPFMCRGWNISRLNIGYEPRARDRHHVKDPVFVRGLGNSARYPRFTIATIRSVSLCSSVLFSYLLWYTQETCLRNEEGTGLVVEPMGRDEFRTVQYVHTDSASSHPSG
jgi:hypothetical protein